MYKRQLLGSATLSAQVKLLPIFSDNMVLQQQTQAPIWGESKPNKKVEITTSWDQKKYTIQADEQGKWSTKVATPVAGGPYNITISDGKKVKLSKMCIRDRYIYWVMIWRSQEILLSNVYSIFVMN